MHLLEGAIGYQKCMSDKRKAHSEALTAYKEACGRQDNMTLCMISAPNFYETSEQMSCKREYGLD